MSWWERVLDVLFGAAMYSILTAWWRERKANKRIEAELKKKLQEHEFKRSQRPFPPIPPSGGD